MRCPITPDHKMVEIAEGLFQCPYCGYGPSHSGWSPFWALYGVEKEGKYVEAMAILYSFRDDEYLIQGMAWEVDQAGRRVVGSIFCTDVAPLDDYGKQPLPAVIKAKGKWDIAPAKPRLTPMMFSNPMGRKELSLTSQKR